MATVVSPPAPLAPPSSRPPIPPSRSLLSLLSTSTSSSHQTNETLLPSYSPPPPSYLSLSLIRQRDFLSRLLSNWNDTNSPFWSPVRIEEIESRWGEGWVERTLRECEGAEGRELEDCVRRLREAVYGRNGGIGGGENVSSSLDRSSQAVRLRTGSFSLLSLTPQRARNFIRPASTNIGSPAFEETATDSRQRSRASEQSEDGSRDRSVSPARERAIWRTVRNALSSGSRRGSRIEVEVGNGISLSPPSPLPTTSSMITSTETTDPSVPSLSIPNSPSSQPTAAAAIPVQLFPPTPISSRSPTPTPTPTPGPSTSSPHIRPTPSPTPSNRRSRTINSTADGLLLNFPKGSRRSSIGRRGGDDGGRMSRSGERDVDELDGRRQGSEESISRINVSTALSALNSPTITAPLRSRLINSTAEGLLLDFPASNPAVVRNPLLLNLAKDVEKGKGKQVEREEVEEAGSGGGNRSKGKQVARDEDGEEGGERDQGVGSSGKRKSWRESLNIIRRFSGDDEDEEIESESEDEGSGSGSGSGRSDGEDDGENTAGWAFFNYPRILSSRNSIQLVPTA